MGKVLLFMEFIPLALTSFPGRLTGDVLCDLSAEGKFSTCPECPHARSAAAHGTTNSYNKLCFFRGKSPALGSTGRCVPALGWPQASWYIHSHGWRAAKAPVSILHTHEPGNLSSQGLGEPFPAL